MTDREVAIALYGQVQDLKVLLTLWQRTSRLNKEEMKELRNNTKAALKVSSTKIISEIYND